MVAPTRVRGPQGSDLAASPLALDAVSEHSRRVIIMEQPEALFGLMGSLTN